MFILEHQGIGPDAPPQPVKKHVESAVGPVSVQVRIQLVGQPFCRDTVACLAGDLDALFEHYRFKEPKWRKASRSTNAIERCFVEVRRRTRPMGVMADRASMSRILYAVFSGINQNQGTATPFPLTHNS